MRRSQPAVREVSAWLDRSVCRCAVDRLEQLRSARADGRDRACAASRGFGLDTYRPAETEQEPVDASDVQVRHGTQTLDRFLGGGTDAGLRFSSNPGSVFETLEEIGIVDLHASG